MCPQKKEKKKRRRGRERKGRNFMAVSLPHLHPVSLHAVWLDSGYTTAHTLLYAHWIHRRYSGCRQFSELRATTPHTSLCAVPLPSGGRRSYLPHCTFTPPPPAPGRRFSRSRMLRAGRPSTMHTHTLPHTPPHLPHHTTHTPIKRHGENGEMACARHNGENSEIAAA